jgi:ectoine hydroxylase-related dioxygenase (phytanoyl-CoA dioxygenase family)
MTTSSPPAADAFPAVDAAAQPEGITDAQAQRFREHGLLVIRNVLRGDELRAMREQTLPLVERATRGAPGEDPDFAYKAHEITGERVPYRVEYVIDKTAAGKALLGHPFILRTVEKLQGPNFVPTWDAMVFKQEGAGVGIAWHRDAATSFVDPERPIFNVDFYLDEADLTNCLWGIPGSQNWTEAKAQAAIDRLNAGGGFGTDANTVPLPMQPGDVILHNILAVHGSPPAQSKLRRVVYYEFRPGEIERERGPHTPEYIPLKQRVLLACVRDRARAPYAVGETPFAYRPDPEFAPPPLGDDELLDTYRYPHQNYWRNPA